MRFVSQSPADTRSLAAGLGGACDEDGGVISLTGPIGAGKTLFVKALAGALGIEERAVASPTFVIAGEYPTARAGAPWRLVHVDFYRVESEGELEAAGLLDWLEAGTLLVAEWGERFLTALPADRLEIRIARGEAAESRILEAAALGPRSQALLARWSKRWP
ncbi:MAG: tRNA (adenosine(37)-N6)-threonylcarbamoyltransferase complex ATPase subunit type 1 TsaE [Deltaproteobacteria bacterium]|nr:tRNA (adenosine(37)-N6)-threonylcarbamoyltransferase complex ATPase subunit type 1 TsaE [Deltaproteobacteria bacterium]